MYQTLEQLGNSDELCNYCQLDPHTNYGSPGSGGYGCEGSKCEEAYQSYLEEVGITDKVIIIKSKTIVHIERN